MRHLLGLDIDRLRQLFPTLADLPPPLARELHGRLHWLRIPAGTCLFDTGTPCQDLPLVLEGSIRVSKRSKSGREIGLYRVLPGEICIVTLSCLLGGNDYPATGVAVEPLRLATLPRPTFLHLLEAHSPFRQMLFDLYGERIADLMQLVEEVAFHRLDERLATWLVENGPHIRLSHQAIAQELGSVREIVSRLLKQFEESGWVRLARGQVEVLDPVALLDARVRSLA